MGRFPMLMMVFSGDGDGEAWLDEDISSVAKMKNGENEA